MPPIKGLLYSSLSLAGVAALAACSKAQDPEPAAQMQEQPRTVPQPPGPSVDERLDELLRIDHSDTPVAIRISADNTFAEARDVARVVLTTSRFQPWIVRQTTGKGLYFVYVGGYSSEAIAFADRLDARAIVNQGAMVQALAGECSSLIFNPAGYHDCAP